MALSGERVMGGVEFTARPKQAKASTLATASKTFGARRARPGEHVLISNGFNKFHLAVAATEVDRHARLAQLVTGFYPTLGVERAFSLLRISRSPKVARLLDRKQPALDGRLIRSLWLAESVHETAALAYLARPLRPIADRLDRASMRLYGRQAVRSVAAAGATTGLYHYRAGFGHTSALLAKDRGMFLLCDHSIAHPAVVQHLIEHKGAMPRPGSTLKLGARQSDLLEDIDRADAVLVNSDFVKETFLNRGWDEACVNVIYWGVDDEFLEAIPERPTRAKNSGDLKLLFAGAINRRKGAHELLTALAALDDVPWRLELAGWIAPEVREKHAKLLQDQRVRYVGTLSRAALAHRMTDAHVFVFPSLAEGSARVVFEALATACYVITTPNSGSIVEDGIHGALIPPGDVESIGGAIRRAAGDVARVAEIGRSNQLLIHSSYRQADYGTALVALYDSLTESRSAA